jgi:dTDP-4-dehydrorhamnose 3,5-epimerase
MKIIKTEIEGLLLIEPDVYEDPRGYFFECYHAEKYREAGIVNVFVQDNESKSGYGVIRGLHYQLEPFSQAKLVRVIRGRVYDVAVDLRQGSPTFGKWLGFELTGKNKKQLFVPRGFAHGFAVLSKKVVLAYKCDRVYSNEYERGISYRDPSLNIDWKIPEEKQVVSGKDKQAPDFENAERNFIFME